MQTPTSLPPPQVMGYDKTTGLTYIDGSTATDYMLCPRRGHIKHGMRRVPAGSTPALGFGSAWHLVMQHHMSGVKPDIAAIADQFGLNTSEDHRNGYMLASAYEKWLAEERVPYETFKLDDKPMVEGPFGFPLTDDIIWCGRIDRIIRLPNGKPAIEDYKTSSADSAQFWRQFNCDIAQTGYLWAATQALGITVDTFIISALFTKKSGVAFAERIYIRDARVFEEWKQTIIAVAKVIKETTELGDTFMLASGEVANKAMCHAHKYGSCPFADICEMPDPTARPQLLNGLGFTDNKWTPLV